jgi:hypothetical protein
MSLFKAVLRFTFSAKDEKEENKKLDKISRAVLNTGVGLTELRHEKVKK